jgi:anti-anti-sigma factor
VLDLSEESFLGSAGISVIIRAMRVLKSFGAELTVRAPSRVARRVLEVTGLVDLVVITDS